MVASSVQSAVTVTTLLPKEARRYVAHTARGTPIRELAREAGCHPSTILRQVRKLETLRDDPLVDRALSLIEEMPERAGIRDADLGHLTDTLGTLTRSGTLLVFNQDLATPALVQRSESGETSLLGSVSLDIAAALVLRGWIALEGGNTVKRYRITPEGRLSLPDLVVARSKPEADTPPAADLFADAGPDRRFRDRSASNGPGTDTPLTALSRRRGPDGKPFLTAAFVAAGERLHEDFVLAGFGRTDLLGWERPEQLDRFYATAKLTRDSACADAAARTLTAIKDLGPGLSDVTLRCCCLREGLETTEKRLGWSARSGKVVLRIALQRLSLFYAGQPQSDRALIG